MAAERKRRPGAGAGDGRDASASLQIYLHPEAVSLWPRLHGLLAEAARRQGLRSWSVTAPPDPVPAQLDFALVPGRHVEAGWLRRHRPRNVVVPHAGIPPTVERALAEVGGIEGGVYNVHHNCKATGETALMLLLSLSRRLLVADRRCRQGDWSFQKVSATPEGRCRLVYNGTAVVIGLGSVGTFVARALLAMGTRVLATRRTASERSTTGDGVEVFPAADLEGLLAEARSVVVTAPLTAQTRGLLDATLLAKCRDGCAIVNVGRAEIVDEHALWREVSSGRLAYAADVWWGEARASLQEGTPFYGSDYPFHTLDNVLITPHYGGGIGLEGIEEERAAAIVDTVTGALSGALKPCDLAVGY